MKQIAFLILNWVTVYKCLSYLFSNLLRTQPTMMPLMTDVEIELDEYELLVTFSLLVFSNLYTISVLRMLNH